MWFLFSSQFHFFRHDDWIDACLHVLTYLRDRVEVEPGSQSFFQILDLQLNNHWMCFHLVLVSFLFSMLRQTVWLVGAGFSRMKFSLRRRHFNPRLLHLLF